MPRLSLKYNQSNQEKGKGKRRGTANHRKKIKMNIITVTTRGGSFQTVIVEIHILVPCLISVSQTIDYDSNKIVVNIENSIRRIIEEVMEINRRSNNPSQRDDTQPINHVKIKREQNL